MRRVSKYEGRERKKAKRWEAFKKNIILMPVFEPSLFFSVTLEPSVSAGSALMKTRAAKHQFVNKG